ncbi:MAG: 4Fe-4S binding protein [Lachnospiraceae bacterium]|nr:4Fe-4S binding protein [Lachnospiraceae bacterium]
MGGFSDRIKKYKRQYTQLVAAVLYNCHFAGFSSGRIFKGATKGVCVPGLNCYSCPGAVFACPLGSLQGALTRSLYKLPLYMLGTLLLFGILLGRMICGFLCPFGLLQELIFRIPFFKVKKSGITRALSCLKYLILAVFAVAIPVIYMVPGFCKYICPAGTLEAGIPLLILDEHLRTQAGWLFSWKVMVLIGIMILCLVFYRGFCRFICPLGAIYSFFNPIAFFGIRVDSKKCTGCNACISTCKMDVKKVGDHECIHCGCCRDICPEGAISYKGR